MSKNCCIFAAGLCAYTYVRMYNLYLSTRIRAQNRQTNSMSKKDKPYLDNEGRALPYPWIINIMLMIVGGLQTLRLRFWSRKPRHTAEKTLRDILTISRNTVYGKEHQ